MATLLEIQYFLWCKHTIIALKLKIFLLLDIRITEDTKCDKFHIHGIIPKHKPDDHGQTCLSYQYIALRMKKRKIKGIWWGMKCDFNLSCDRTVCLKIFGSKSESGRTELTPFLRNIPATWGLKNPGMLASVFDIPKTIPAYSGAISAALAWNPGTAV